MPWRTLCGFPPTSESLTLKLPFKLWRPDTVITDSDGNEMFVLIDQQQEMRSYEVIFGDLDGRRLCCVKRHLQPQFWKDGYYICTYVPNYPGQRALHDRDVDNKRVYPFSYIQINPMKGRFYYRLFDNNEGLLPPSLKGENPWLGVMVVAATPAVRAGKWAIKFKRTTNLLSTSLHIDQWKNRSTIGPGVDLLASLCISYIFDRYQCQPLISVFGRDPDDEYELEEDDANTIHTHEQDERNANNDDDDDDIDDDDDDEEESKRLNTNERNKGTKKYNANAPFTFDSDDDDNNDDDTRTTQHTRNTRNTRNNNDGKYSVASSQQQQQHHTRNKNSNNVVPKTKDFLDDSSNNNNNDNDNATYQSVATTNTKKTIQSIQRGNIVPYKPTNSSSTGSTTTTNDKKKIPATTSTSTSTNPYSTDWLDDDDNNNNKEFLGKTTAPIPTAIPPPDATSEGLYYINSQQQQQQQQQQQSLHRPAVDVASTSGFTIDSYRPL